jgi:hypothetical protein
MPLPPASPAGAPEVDRFESDAAAVAAGSDLTTELARAVRKGYLTAARVLPGGTLTGAATNNRTFNVIDQTQANKVLATVNFASGTNLAAGVELDIPLSGSDTQVAAGDVIALQSVHVGTGLADPGSTVIIELTSFGE